MNINRSLQKLALSLLICSGEVCAESYVNPFSGAAQMSPASTTPLIINQGPAQSYSPSSLKGFEAGLSPEGVYLAPQYSTSDQKNQQAINSQLNFGNQQPQLPPSVSYGQPYYSQSPPQGSQFQQQIVSPQFASPAAVMAPAAPPNNLVQRNSAIAGYQAPYRSMPPVFSSPMIPTSAQPARANTMYAPPQAQQMPLVMSPQVARILGGASEPSQNAVESILRRGGNNSPNAAPRANPQPSWINRIYSWVNQPDDATTSDDYWSAPGQR